MRHDAVAVATISLARSDAEAALLRTSLERLAAHGMPVWVADGGSSPDFLESLSKQPPLTLSAPVQPGLVSQVQSSLAAAASSDRPYVLYTEPDKERFFAAGLGEFIERAPDFDQVGVVIASRSTRSFQTYPSIQQRTESMINTLTGDIVGTARDYSYGPFLVRQDLVRRLAGSLPHVGWGWRHFLFVVAHRLGYRVLHVEGDHECPPDQRVDDDEERAHRLRQLAQNVEGLVLGLTAVP